MVWGKVCICTSRSLLGFAAPALIVLANQPPTANSSDIASVVHEYVTTALVAGQQECLVLTGAVRPTPTMPPSIQTCADRLPEAKPNKRGVSLLMGRQRVGACHTALMWRCGVMQQYLGWRPSKQMKFRWHISMPSVSTHHLLCYGLRQYISSPSGCVAFFAVGCQ